MVGVLVTDVALMKKMALLQPVVGGAHSSHSISCLDCSAIVSTIVITTIISLWCGVTSDNGHVVGVIKQCVDILIVKCLKFNYF